MSVNAAGDTVLYGIANCDTCRKARRWLDEHGVEYRFHDLRTEGLDRRVLEVWVDAVGWEQLLNRRSRTWRDLPASVRDGLHRRSASALLMAQPLLIKRPVLAGEGKVHTGFSPSAYTELFPS